MYQLKKLKSLLLLLFVAVTAKAQPEAGKIYRFVNKANPEQSLAVVSETKSSVSPTADHYLQYWLLEKHPGNDATWTLRNLGNGKYLQRAGRSVFWGFVDAASDATPLYYLTQDGYCTFSSANNVNDGACMHYALSRGGIVGWDFSADATQWTMTEISSVTADDLTDNWEALDEFNKAYDDDMANDYASALDALFADAACTTLESTYASMSVSAIQEDDNYKALPAALQELVLKVRNGVWTEANFVDVKAEWESDQAKKFRVQLYEPHSIAGDITSWLGINAHNNMDNPTGIFADCRDVVYVMVEGTIKEGASLYLYGLRGHGQMGSYNDDNAVQLHEGLNVVPYISDGNALWINYVVDTYNGNGSTDEERFQYKLSSYDPLKINIAGGHINGYYNAVGDALWGAPDDDTDWAYYKDRASLESFTLLSHRVTMQFYMYTTNGSPGLYNLLDNIAVPETPYCFSGTKGTSATFSQYEGMGLDASTGKINIMLEAWNRIAYSQFATLGVLDAATIDKMNEKYPRWYNNWTERGKIYDYTTGNDGQSYKEYCGGVDYSEYFNHHCLAISNTTGYMSGGWKSSNYNINTAESIIDKIANEAGPVWGPAHEIGHQHQTLFTLNGLTEVTNNLHSNVAVWYMGMGTSRVNGTEGSLAKVLEAFNTEGSDYYTNNIWALTQMYYRLWLYYHLAGNNPQFYPRLMENLRREPLEKGYNVGPGGLLRFYKHCCVAAEEDLTEFFRAHGLLSVMTDRFVGDYSNSVYNQSQEQIDAAIAEVKALGLPVNIAPLFISDATPDVTYGHDGTTQRSYWDGNSTSSGNNAEVGSYIDFVNGEAVGTAPTLTIESTTVTIDGLDGVGIAIFNEKGEIVGFSTKSTFELSEECAALLASGEATVKAVNADNSTVPIEVTDPTQIKYDLLGSLLDEANGMLALSDDTNTKLGWYRPSALKALNTAYTEAKKVYDAQDANSYTAAYDMLKIAYDEVRNNADAVISLKTGSGYAYRLVNKAYPERSMVVDASDSDSDGNSDEMFAWATEDTDVQKWYFEASDTEGRYYLKNKETDKYPGNTSQSAVLSADKTEDTKGKDGGAYAYELRDMGNGLWALVGSTGLHCSASQSYNIVGWGTDAEATLWYITAVEVDDIIEARDELENLVEKTELLVDEMAVVQYKGDIDLSSCNITSNATEEGHETKYLIDGNPNTYFHTVWKNSEVAEEHYIQVDLGEGVSITEFVWTYTTYTTQWATDFPTKVEVTGSNDAQLWSDIKTLSDLPTTQNTEYTSETLGNSNDAYRYLRFTVTGTASNGSFNGYHYFGLAEFGLNRFSTLINRYAEYSSHVTSDEILTAYEELLTAQSVYNNAAATVDDLTTAMEDLQSQYDILLVAYNNAKNAALTAKKAELQTLIDNTTSLISSCGTVTYTPGTYSGDVALQTDDAGANFYLYCNAPYIHDANSTDYSPASDGYNILDGDYGTFLHTDWSDNAPSEDHYLRVFMGDVSMSQFILNYSTRGAGGDVYPGNPTEIVVEGCNTENGNYVVIATLTSDDANPLPKGSNLSHYISNELGDGTAYKYIRFRVTKNQSGRIVKGHHWFYISEFGLTAIGTPESYTVELGNDAGGATEALMLAAYKESASAQATHTLATTLSQVEEAIAKLQADYDALKSAKESTVEKTYYVQVVGGNANGGVEYGGNSYLSSASFEVPKNLTVADLTAIPLDGYAEAVVTLNGTTITVTYNKIYTVQVVGLDGQGGVQFGDGSYNHGQELNALNLEVGNLIAIVLEGYVADIALGDATITVTYKKVYTVQVIGGDGNGGVTFAEDTYANGEEIHVLGALDTNQLRALPMDGYAPYVSVEDATIHVTYKMIYRVAVVGGDGNGGVTFEENTYANNAEVHALSSIELNQLTAVDGSDYVGTITLDGRTITVTYCKLVKDLSELRNYKAYHIRARSGEGYFAYNSSIPEDYVSLRGMTNWSHNNLPSNADVANKYKEAVSLSDKTVVWQIINEGDSYYLYQPEKKAYVTRVNRDYKFTDTKTALDGIRQNDGEHLGTFGIHAGGGYSDGSTNFACIATNEASNAVRNWTWSDHGSVLQIIENPYVYALDYAVTVIGNDNGSVDFEDESYADGETLSATELLTASDLTVKSIDGYEHVIEVNKVNATITITYTAIDKTELINLITNTEDLVNSASSHLGSSLNVTQDLIEETNEVLATAIEVCDNSSANREEYEAALAALQAAKSKLATAIAYAGLPVQLTFDVNSPVTYKIKIARANTPVLAYDESSSMVAVTTFELGNKSHGWYFMATTDGKVRIMPYHDKNTTLALSTNDFNEGNSKVMGMAIGTDGYTQEWTIIANGDNAGWYNITTINPSNTETTWYFSNHGGVTQKMGFYNDPNDSGTLFKFEQADFSKSDAYYTLYNYYHGEVKLATGSIVGSTAVGYFSEAVATPYNVAYNNATAVLANTTAKDEDYISAHEALKKANEALVPNMPEEGKFYRFVSADTKNGRADGVVYANPADNKMYWSKEKETSDATAIWTIAPADNGTYHITNLHTGTSIGEFIGSNPSPLREEGGAVSIKPLSGDGQVGFISNGTMMHAQGDYSAIVHWETGAGDASAWRIVEVENMSLVKFAVSISQFEHAGLYLNYPVTIPDGVKAYYLDGKKITIDNGVGSLNLTKIEEDVIPAKTAVILYAPQDNYEFVYADEPNYKYEDNLFTGSSYQTYREAEGNHYYYVFGQNNGEIGLYKNGVKYNATGAEGTTHYKMSANKILFDWDGSVSNVSSFRFRLGTGGQTTSLEDALMMDNSIIYDLYGRRILEVKTSGLYIVNGEKRYIQVK